jgi:hypothetical protein
LVTGDAIKDGTVTTKDVKNKTLKVKDFAAGTKSKLRGAAGPAGATGLTGATGQTGPTGPTGPSNVYGRWNDNPTAMVAGNKAVLDLAVQPGSYWAYSKVWARRTGAGPFIDCRLDAPGIAFDFTQDTLPDVVGAEGNVSNQIVFTTPTALTVTLYCRGSNTNAVWKKLTLLKVGDVTNNSGPDVS